MQNSIIRRLGHFLGVLSSPQKTKKKKSSHSTRRKPKKKVASLLKKAPPPKRRISRPHKKLPLKISRKRAERPRKKKTALSSGKPELVAEVTHYFPKVRAAVLQVKKRLRLGDAIWISGPTTNFRQKVSSMQINHVSIVQAKRREEIGLLVQGRVRASDKVWRIV